MIQQVEHNINKITTSRDLLRMSKLTDWMVSNASPAISFIRCLILSKSFQCGVHHSHFHINKLIVYDYRLLYQIHEISSIFNKTMFFSLTTETDGMNRLHKFVVFLKAYSAWNISYLPSKRRRNHKCLYKDSLSTLDECFTIFNYKSLPFRTVEVMESDCAL